MIVEVSCEECGHVLGYMMVRWCPLTERFGFRGASRKRTARKGRGTGSWIAPYVQRNSSSPYLISVPATLLASVHVWRCRHERLRNLVARTRI